MGREGGGKVHASGLYGGKGRGGEEMARCDGLEASIRGVHLMKIISESVSSSSSHS